MKKLLNEASSSEYTKIRSYVVTQIIKSGDTPRRLMSVRKIGSIFGVSHPTVIKALKDLLADGLLTTSPGRRGTFTCPEKLNGRKDVKVIGMISSDGKEVFLNRHNNRLAFEFADVIMEKSNDYLVRQVSLCSVKAHAADEILSMGLSGVIWIAPTDAMLPTLQSLRQSGIPLLIAARALEGFNFVHADVEAEYRKATGLMLDEGRRRIALLVPDKNVYVHAENAERGWRDAFAERGLSCDDALLLTQSQKLESDFERRLDAIKPDGICFCDLQEKYFASLKRKFDLADECRIYSARSSITRKMNDYIGYVGHPKTRDAARQAIEAFSKILGGGEAQSHPCQIKIDVEITMEGKTE